MGNANAFSLGRFPLQCGITLPDAKLVYQTYGTLNAAKDNAVLLLTWYSGTHQDAEWMLGPGRALDPDRYFIVIPNLFGNGLSSSPSNTEPPWDRARFPLVSVYDNVVAQERMVREVLGIERFRLVTGWSMGAMQTFQWASQFPEMVDAIAPTCGAARCSPHNAVMLDGIRAAMTLDEAFKEGWYDTPPTRGLRAAARVYAGWGTSQAFFREGAYKTLGFASVEDFVVGAWEGFLLPKDANDLLSQFATWIDGDIGKNPVHGGDFDKALGAISARAIVMPGSTDLYFPPEDSEYEVARMPNAELRPFPSIYGHFAASWFNADDVAFHDAALRELLEG